MMLSNSFFFFKFFFFLNYFYYQLLQSDGAVVTGPDCGKDITPSGSTISGKDHEKEISQVKEN